MKKFLIIGNGNAVTYKEVFPFIKRNEMWLGVRGICDMAFTVPSDYELRETRSWRDESGVNWRSLGNACWFTNMDFSQRHTPIELTKKYNEAEYPKYDNYDAIEVSKVVDIPIDFGGKMGVPITFMNKYCPEQFEILGHEHDIYGDGGSWCISQFEINGKGMYSRILIRKK